MIKLVITLRKVINGPNPILIHGVINFFLKDY